jgi:hypothetical protein
MIKFAIRLATLAICATALIAVPMVTPAKAATSSSKAVKKHKRIHINSGTGNSGAAGQTPHYADPRDDPDRSKASY